MQTKECKYCGKQFEPSYCNEKYCVDCRALGGDILNGKVFDCRKVQICEHCGIEYVRNHKTRFCTDECSKDAQLQKAKDKRAAKEKAKHTRSCIVCGKEYVTASANKLCCSNKCRVKNRPPHPPIKIKSITYTCQYCGKEYHPKTAVRDKYCSRECYFTYRRETQYYHPRSKK